MMWLVVVGIGLIGGFVSGMFGVGGAVVIVPLLVLFARLPQHTANGTSLAALVVPVGLLGVLEYYRRGQVNLPYAAMVAAGVFVGAFIGAKVAGHVPEAMLRKMFGALLLVISVRLIAW